VTIRVSAAQPRDCAALHRLIHEHAADEQATATISTQQLSAFLAGQHPSAHLLVARREEDVLGYASLTMDFSLWHGKAWAHLDCLFVRSSDRSRGIGKQLLQASRALARSLEAGWMEWQTPSWNEDAIRFYLREGAILLPKVRLQLGL